MSDPVSRLNTALEGRYAIERESGVEGALDRLTRPPEPMPTRPAPPISLPDCDAEVVVRLGHVVQASVNRGQPRRGVSTP